MIMVTGPRAEKALRLFDEHRVYLSRIDETRALVAGDNGFYKVTANPHGVHCACPAWRPDRYCAHALAAMLAWQDTTDREHALAEAA